MAAGALPIALAFHSGGYFAPDWGWSALALYWLAAAALILRDRISLGRFELAMLASLAAFVCWTAISAAWSTSVERSILETQRELVYLGGLLVVFLVARGRSVPVLLAGICAAAGVISSVALGRLFLGDVSTTDAALARLSTPLGYPNALALVAVIGALVSSGFAAHSQTRWARAPAAAGLVLFALAIYFTFSRGAWIALALGIAVMLAVDPRRTPLLHAVGAALPFASLAVWAASRADALKSFDHDLPGASREGYLMALVTLLLAAAAALSTDAALRLSPGRVSAAAAAAILTVVLAGSTAVLAYYGSQFPARSTSGSRALVRDEGAGGDVVSLSGRVPVWRQAWRDWEHHLGLGSGAGTFEQYWLQHRRSSVNVRDVHSLYLETLAEVGPVGLGLLLAMLAVPFAAVARVRSQPYVPAALAAYLAYVVHAAGDWDWEMPVVTLLGLLCGAAVVVAVRPAVRRVPRTAIRAAALVGTLALAVVAFDGLIGNGALAASKRAAAAGHWQEAAAQAHKATRWLPWSAEAWVRHADARIGEGRLHSAHANLVKAVRKSRREWRAWWELMRVDSGRNRRLELERAELLNPRAPEVVQFLLAPGSLTERPSYDDTWRGWPVAPVHRQHPIRSSFLDPRRGTLETGGEAAYHIGIDIVVDDDRPEPGAPPGRTHRVYAIEGGEVFLVRGQARRACVDRRLDVGHIGYWHVDTTGVVTEHEVVRPGQMIGWTCKGLGHVHLSEWMDVYGHRAYINPLRPGWKLAPFVDRTPPRIHAIRFYRPELAKWRGRPRLLLPQGGTRLSQTRAGRVVLSGLVDARAWIDDGKNLPYSVVLTLFREPNDRRVFKRAVFRSALLLTDPLATQPVPLAYHYAPGTTQGSIYWFRLFARPTTAYWQTDRIANGNYRLRVEAQDVAGNTATAWARVTVAN